RPVHPLARHGHGAPGGAEPGLLRDLLDHLRADPARGLQPGRDGAADPADDHGSRAGAEHELRDRHRPARDRRFQGLLRGHGDRSGYPPAGGRAGPGLDHRRARCAHHRLPPRALRLRGDEDVLHDIDFAAVPAEKVALVGESGGGKSTIVNLLLGLYEAREGQVLVAGHDTAELPLDVLRSRIGVVFQDASLFSGTIWENISYGRPEASAEEIRVAAERANAHRFIERFPAGYQQVIGERGLRLSGGQRQRIAVARAILKDAPILVLDEATSALDTKAERQVQAGLDELMRDRTSLIIAH